LAFGAQRGATHQQENIPMKICASPANTSCRYQRRLARDQADPDNGTQADPDAVQQAYADLYQCLASKDDSEALAMLKHLMNALTGDGAMDEPMPFPGRPTPAMDSAIRSDRRQASAYGFAQKFPGASRIRVVG
jgi:hypothetical protein